MIVIFVIIIANKNYGHNHDKKTKTYPILIQESIALFEHRLELLNISGEFDRAQSLMRLSFC